MRLKEDTSSYRASGIRVRDARHVHNGPSVPKHRAGKDTKRWCGGKVGREHKPKCMTKREWPGRNGSASRWYVLACTECGKELAHHFPWREDETKPAWVTP